MSNYPASLTIEPVGSFDVSVRIPGSKSLTNRALLLAALAPGSSTLTDVLLSDDSWRMLEALPLLGFEVELDESARTVRVVGEGGRIPAQEADLFLGNAGTAFRFLTAALCLGEGRYQLRGIPRMHERPIGQLLDALRELGASIRCLGEEGYPPLEIQGGGLRRPAGGELRMQPTLSSQYLSAILQAGPCMPQGVTLVFDGPVTSRPYVEMTVELMRRFGAQVQVDPDFTRIEVAPGGYQTTNYPVEPDASNASYILGAAAVAPGRRATVQGLGTASLQGDVGFARVLEQMGAQVLYQSHAIAVTAPADGILRGVDVDLNAMPDMAQTLACVAMFAQGPTTMRDIGNLRVKETDRMAAVQAELTKLGARVEIHGDDLTVHPPADGQITPASIETYDDHRMAMAFSIIGLTRPGVTILDPGCVAKTYPEYFDDLARLQAAASA